MITRERQSRPQGQMSCLVHILLYSCGISAICLGVFGGSVAAGPSSAAPPDPASSHAASPSPMSSPGSLPMISSNRQDIIIDLLLHNDVDAISRELKGSPDLNKFMNYDYNSSAVGADGYHPRLVCTQTPLMFATRHSDVATVAVILSLSPDIDRRDAFGDTALSIAVGSNSGPPFGKNRHGGMQEGMDKRLRPPSEDVVELLLRSGASVNAQNDYGVSALMAAASLKDGAAIVRRLLDSGARPQQTDNEGRRAIDFSAPDSETRKLLTELRK